MDKYIVTGTTDRSRSGTEEVVFEKGKNGEPTKFISKTHPEELSRRDLETLKSLGVTCVKVSDEKATEIEEKAAEESTAASDTSGSAPIFGDKPSIGATQTTKKSTSGGSGSGNENKKEVR